MEYRDKIYGDVKIEEPVILELIAGKSLQRLKKLLRPKKLKKRQKKRKLKISVNI